MRLKLRRECDVMNDCFMFWVDRFQRSNSEEHGTISARSCSRRQGDRLHVGWKSWCEFQLHKSLAVVAVVVKFTTQADSLATGFNLKS